MPKVSITDLGPIEKFTFTVPEAGGVVVLEGCNGLGKSYTLKAVEALTTGRGGRDMTHRDGTFRGEVEGFGATLKVVRQARRAGELQVTSLEGRFSVLDLVDPQLLDPVAADLKRIKALVQLAGGSGADVSLFYPIMGGKEGFDEFVGADLTKTTDLVTMAASIKRDLEKRARGLEDDAKKEIARAEAARHAADGIDLSAPDDGVLLQEDLELAIAAEARLKAEARAAVAASERAEEAGRQLRLAETNYSGLGVGVARTQVETAKNEVATAAARLAELEHQLRTAKDGLLAKQTIQKAAEEAFYAAELHESTIAKWRETLAAELPKSPTTAEIDEATADVLGAREALERGAVARAARKRISEADGHAHEAARLHTQADKLRTAGQATDDVLSEVVGRLGCPLRVVNGRLVTDTDRGQELFCDLSRGEQWTMTIRDIAVPALGPGGLLVIDQEGWEGLDSSNRSAIAEAAEGTGLVVLTAEKSDAPTLSASVYQAA